MKHAQRRPRTKPASGPSLLERITPTAAAIDCGSEEHYVAVPTDRDAAPVRAFKTFTTDLHRLADWLTACGVTTVAMESTGVYWIPLYEILEARGLDVVLVNARHVKNVPGRKTDVVDCQWLQQLHSVGLLRGSFRPTAAIAALRAYLRHRETLVQSAATHVQRMQKALVQMNLQLSTVISDITGVTGLRIVREIIAGPFAPRAFPRFLATPDPSATLSPSADFPGAPVIRPTLLRGFRRGTRRASPVARCVWVTGLSLPAPPEPAAASARLRRPMLPSRSHRPLGLRGLDVAGPPHVHLRYGPVTRSPSLGWLCR